MTSKFRKFIGWNDIYWPSVHVKVPHMQHQIRVAYNNNQQDKIEKQIEFHHIKSKKLDKSE